MVIHVSGELVAATVHVHVHKVYTVVNTPVSTVIQAVRQVLCVCTFENNVLCTYMYSANTQCTCTCSVEDILTMNDQRMYMYVYMYMASNRQLRILYVLRPVSIHVAL